jgi:hypothetical protein
MDKLPQLEIEADLNNLESDTEENVSIVVEDLTGDVLPKTEPDQIFMNKPTNGKVKMPTNKNISKKVVPKKEVEIPVTEVTEVVEGDEEEKPKKKQLSEKQRAHLEKIRAKALEAKREKMRLKKEVKERVEVEVKKTRQRRKKEVEPQKEELSEDFKQRLKVPSDEEIQMKKKKEEEMSFINFMSNMEKYQYMRHSWEQEKQARQPKPKPPPTPKQERKPAPQKLPETVKPKPLNPYEELFKW